MVQICDLGLRQFTGRDVTMTRYRDPVCSARVPGGMVHKLPTDL